MERKENKDKKLEESSNDSNENKGKKDSKIYVIQKHDSSNLHYDLRLEMNGVLKSWAIPKSPPMDKGVKRLAIKTKDHSVDYADFEGIIPEGQYGGGEVEIWDEGTYELREREEEKIVFDVNGDKLQGKYCLIKFSGEENNWLFFKCD